jgi:hypothetical protein
MKRRLSLLALLVLAPAAGAQVSVQLLPSQDNTLFEPDTLGERSNGAGPQLYAGRVGGFGGGVGLRRGLIRFDVAGSVPAGATIQAVTLTVECSKVPLQDSGVPRTHELHRAIAAWGESTSDAGVNGGAGAAPQPGDATWSDAFFPGTPWGTAGGDYTGAVSSTIVVPLMGSYVFASTPQLVADVQAMLDSPAGNHGWVITGDEVVAGVARAFDTREAPGYPFYTGVAPVLQIDYVPQGVPALPRGGVLVLLVGVVASALWIGARSRA